MQPNPIAFSSRRLLAALLASTAAACVMAADGEPSEAEMRAALEARYAGVNGSLQDTASRCNNREFQRGQGDPLLAMQCLQLALSGGTTQGGRSVQAPSFRLSRFQKIACEKAQGRAGYYCDYVAGTDSDMRNLPPSLGALLRQGEVIQKRFVRQGSNWIMLD